MTNKITLAFALLCPLAGLAADNLKPLDVKLGLWETSTTTQMSGTPPISDELLAKLTPEQRARMDAAAKARQARGAQTTVRKSCLTREDLNRMQAWGDDTGACKRTVLSSSATKTDVHLECAFGTTKSVGDVHVEALSPANVKGTSEMTSAGGTRGMTIKVSFTSQWLGASCGDLKK